MHKLHPSSIDGERHIQKKRTPHPFLLYYLTHTYPLVHIFFLTLNNIFFSIIYQEKKNAKLKKKVR